jgi:hypothetical protein
MRKFLNIIIGFVAFSAKNEIEGEIKKPLSDKSVNGFERS